MDTYTIILGILTFIQGLAAGICLDKALVNLPTRHKIGIIPYADFARNNDLGNGLKLYPFLVVGGGFLILVFTIVSYFVAPPSIKLFPLSLTVLFVLGYLFSTFKAAPIMWSLKTTPNDEAKLKLKIDQFEYWNAWRAFFQIIAFISLIWTLIVSKQ